MVYDSKSPTRVRATLRFFLGGSERWVSSKDRSVKVCSDPSKLAAGVNGGSLFFGLFCDTVETLGEVLPVMNGNPIFVDAGVAAGVT